MTVTALKPLSYAAAIACLALVTAGVGRAQRGAAVAVAPTDVYQLNYFANNVAAAPDQTVRIDNPGLTYGNLCAMIYVFDNDQQLTECCGCIETHNGLRTLSVQNDLTKNPLTGVVSNNGVVKVVSASPNGVATACDPTSNVIPTPNLRAWATHVQAVSSAAYSVTETNFQQSALGAAELGALQQQCTFIHIVGSGSGICTCGSGD